MPSKIIRRQQGSIANANHMHPLVTRLYAARGIKNAREASLDLKDLLPPHLLKGIGAGVLLLADAIENNRKILIVGDFDADGATSTAICILGLRMLGATCVDFLVPNRFKFGYGLTPEIVEVAKTMQPDLLMTVDNGISSYDGVAAAIDFGMKVLITDHHLPGTKTPPAHAIINPNQIGCDFPSKALAGCGVAFYTLLALRAYLRDMGFFESKKMKEPNLGTLLDIVAVGTVADVVPLDQNNRILVHNGLNRIKNAQCRPGIAALAAVAGRRIEKISSTDLGFAIGPRLNAAGRMDDMSIGIRCLIEDDPQKALELATQLDALNKERKEVENQMQGDAMESLSRIDICENQLPYGLCVYQSDWHQGVIGILASRIKDKYHRPVIAFAKSEGSDIKGSARSVAGLHIRDALDAIAARNPGLITKFGGHAMAAGLSLPEENLEKFKEEFDAEVKRHLSVDDLVGSFFTDGELNEGEINIETAEILKSAGPWGQAFPEPLFDGEFVVVSKRELSEGRHMKLTLRIPGSKKLVDAIQFNTNVSAADITSIVRAAYKLDINEYKGEKRIQLMLETIQS